MKTKKAARQAGYHQIKSYEYGGHQIVVKGSVFVKEPKVAKSKTEWSRLGFRIRKGEQPHSFRYSRTPGYYDVFRDDQIEPKREVNEIEPVEIKILAALWVINRRAKRMRDGATRSFKKGRHTEASNHSDEKQRLYAMKEQVVHYLMESGILRHVGRHRFPEGNWAEVLAGGDFRFHRPCPPPDNESDGEQIGQIEAQPRCAHEPRLKDALFTIELFLRNKPVVNVYHWPEKPRKRHYFTGSDSTNWSGSGDDDDEYEDSVPSPTSRAP
ncbi:MAG: hypothetical protein AB7I37_15635 [Pirellulales bacterium]